MKHFFGIGSVVNINDKEHTVRRYIKDGLGNWHVEFSDDLVIACSVLEKQV